MNVKFLKWQFKAWLTPFVILATILVVTSVLRTNLDSLYLTAGSSTSAQTVAQNVANTHFSYIFTIAYIGSIVFAFLSADYKYKPDRYDAYAQLPVRKNEVKLTRTFLGLGLILGMFTAASWASTGAIAVRLAYLARRGTEGTLLEFNYLYFLLAYFVGFFGLAFLHFINSALANMGHSVWSALMCLLFGNIVLGSSLPLILQFFIPRDAMGFISPGSATIYQLFGLLAVRAAKLTVSLKDAQVFAYYFNGITTCLVGGLSLVYLFMRKDMSGEFAGSKRYDTFGKELLPHLTALGVAAALGTLGRQISTPSYAIMPPELGTFLIVVFMASYLIGLLAYFGTLRIRGRHWIIFACVSILAVVFFFTGLALGYPVAAR